MPFILKVVLIIALAPWSTYSLAESLRDAAERSGSIASRITHFGPIAAGETREVEWSIISYVDIVSDIQVKFPDGQTFSREGVRVDRVAAAYSIGSEQSFEHSYKATVTVPSDTSAGVATVGFYTSRKDDSEPKGMYALFPANVVRRPVGSQAKGFEWDITSYNSSSLDLWPPCSLCSYSGPYDREWFGDGTNHLAKDYPAFVGNSVRAIADGKIHKIYPSIGGFGGDNPSKNGPALIIEHKKSSGNSFFALYGHMAPNSGLSEGQFVTGNDVIGTVTDYVDAGRSWPHLHFGVWDAESNFPTTGLGYGSVRSFVNPVPFLATVKYQIWTS